MAKQETMEAVEKTIDAVEDTVETLERIPNVNLNGTTKGQQILILSTVAVSSAVVATVLTSFVQRKLAERKARKASESRGYIRR